MTIIDLCSVATIAVCIAGACCWLKLMRDWPLRWSVVIALWSNLLFYSVRWSGLFAPADLNLFSAVRVLLTVLVLAAIPLLIGRVK